MIKEILGFLSSPVTAWIEKRESRKYMKEEGHLAIKKAEVALKVAELQGKAERAMQNDKVDADYDLQAQREKRYTIADEVLMFVTIIMIACTFLFPAQMALGYAALAAAPWWVEFAIVGIYISVFGLMRLFRAWSPFKRGQDK